jgi:hypothetical protein
MKRAWGRVWIVAEVSLFIVASAVWILYSLKG